MKGVDLMIIQNYQYNTIIAEEYIEFLKHEDLSPLTVKNYNYKLQHFLKVQEKKIDALNYEDVANFLNSKQHLSNSSRLLYITALSSFFTFCVSKGYMSIVLIKKRWRVKRKKLLPKPLGRPERAELRILSEQLSDRDRAIIEFILSSGCRENEASTLDIGDFNFKSRTVKVMGKGRKERTVQYSDTAALLLQKISQGRDTDSPMFLNKYNQRLSNKGIYDVVSCAGIQMETVNHNIGPHVLRHTFGSHLLSNGADLLTVSKALGHAHVQTTLGYAKNLDDDLVIKFHKLIG